MKAAVAHSMASPGPSAPALKTSLERILFIDVDGVLHLLGAVSPVVDPAILDDRVFVLSLGVIICQARTLISDV